MPLPNRLAEPYARHLRAPLQDPAALRERVRAHLGVAEAAHARDPLVDLETATRVAAACLALLDAWADLADEHRRHVQAACTWFVQADDGEADFASVVGFDDDAAVLDHACDAIGRGDLRIDIG